MTSPSQLNIFQRLAVELLWLFAWCFAVLPHWFKYYVVEEWLVVVLCYLLRYRRKVVLANLANSFPDLDEAARNRIARRFYRTLAEIFVHTIDLAHMPDRKARRMLTVRDSEQQRALTRGRDWIAMLAHSACWEYSLYWGLYDATHVVLGVYHPLHNPIVDTFYRRLRNNRFTVPVSMHEIVRFYLQHRDEGIDGRNMLLGLIADQNPPLRPDSHWFRFLNQDSVFFDGGEKLALKFRLPVYYVHIDRVRRGRYCMSFEPIYDGVEPVAPNEITERYVRILERHIQERPECWMWSHRRWKHRRQHVQD